MRRTFPLSTSYNTSWERIMALKSFPLAIRGILCLENDLKNTIWPRQHLQLAEIRKCPCSCQSRRRVIRHGLRSPIQFWKMMGSVSNESSDSALKDAHTHYWTRAGLKYHISEEYKFAGPSMQQQSTVDRTIMRHQARHWKLNLIWWIMVYILNDSPYKVPQYSYVHYYLPLSRSSIKKSWKTLIVVTMWTLLNHHDSGRGRPSNANLPWLKNIHVKLKLYWKSSRYILTFVYCLERLVDENGPSALICLGHMKKKKV